MSGYFPKLLKYSFVFFAFLLIFGSTNLSPFELAAGVCGIAATALVFRERSIGIQIPFFWYPLVAFTILLFVPFLYINNPNIQYLFITLYLIVLYVSVHFWYTRFPAILTFAIYGYVGGGVISSTFGIFGYLGGIFGIEAIQHLFFFWGSGRVNVFYTDPVVYGAFLVPSILFLAHKAIIGKDRRTYILYGCLTLLLFMNLILTGSRGAWLNFMGAGFLFYLLYSPIRSSKVFFRSFLLIISGFFISLLIIFIIPVGERTYYALTLETREGASDKPRLEHLTNVPKLLFNRSYTEQIFGSGSGMYERASHNGFSAHSLYIRTLYEQGVLGLLLFGIFIFLLLQQMWRKRSEAPLYATLLFSIVVGILIHGFFVDVIHWRHFWFIIAFAM